MVYTCESPLKISVKDSLSLAVAFSFALSDMSATWEKKTELHNPCLRHMYVKRHHAGRRQSDFLA